MSIPSQVVIVFIMIRECHVDVTEDALHWRAALLFDTYS